MAGNNSKKCRHWLEKMQVLAQKNVPITSKNRRYHLEKSQDYLAKWKLWTRKNAG
ncbi:MAG TPA: hypothetical protein VN958_03645 [Chitinophagaceae bacterium]|nr:hypothetical protein [Chitinophagaceae bacterium]